MKLITAIIKPFMIDDVRDALLSHGIQGLTITEVRGFGLQRGHTEIYRGAEYAATFVPKLRIEVGAQDDAVDTIVQAIVTSSRTGTIGDGKIFVTSLDQVIRIRTGERDDDAL